MFRKLISEVTFSSSLVGELGRYAQRLRREELLRQASVWAVFAATATVALVYFLPPSSPNAAHSTDLVRGGIASREELLEKYSTNDNDIKSMLTALGLTHGDILNSQEETVSLASTHHLAKRAATTHQQDTAYAYSYKKHSGKVGAVHLYPVDERNAPQSKNLPALTGSSEALGEFAILLASGNVALPNPPRTPASACAPSSPADDCPSFSFSKTAYNATQKIDATTATAQPRDRINYTITATNRSDAPATTVITDAITDTLEYADIVDTDGGIFDAQTETVSWTTPRLEVGESYQRTLSVRLKPDIAATAQGVSNHASFDCTIVNTVGTATTITVACPALKQVETVSRSLPSVPLAVSFYAGIALLAVTLLLYIRAKIFREEVRLIRKDINSGTFL